MDLSRGVDTGFGLIWSMRCVGAWLDRNGAGGQTARLHTHAEREALRDIWAGLAQASGVVVADRVDVGWARVFECD